MHRRRRRRLVNLICVPVGCLIILAQGVSLACTTAVISGRVTPDGRPLLWKNRDTTSGLHNEVVIFDDGDLRAIAVVNAGQRNSVWMGSNVAGFCIENSLTPDMGNGSSNREPKNGRFMKLALQQCRTIDDFRKLLDETNESGRRTIATYGVIDAAGGAGMFEVGPDSYVFYDANDPEVAPLGYIVRSNFTLTANGLDANPAETDIESLGSAQRYLRACTLLDLDSRDGEIRLEYVLQNLCRDLADAEGQPIPGSVNAPHGHLPPVIETTNTLSRTTTVSAAVFCGVRRDEDPRWTTMWTILGDPKFSLAVPCWATLGSVAPSLQNDRGGPLGEIALTIRDWSLTKQRTGIETRALPGVWTRLWPREMDFIRRSSKLREELASVPFDASCSRRLAELHAETAREAMQAMNALLIETKQLAITDLDDDAPARMVDSIKVGIYDHSGGSANGPKNLMGILTPERGYECIRLHPDEIAAGGLLGLDVLVVPGGSGSLQANKLGEQGRNNIRRFVTSGGGYVGICAGAYLASNHYSWSLGILDAKVWDRAHWARGTGTVRLQLTDNGIAMFSSDTPDVSVHYGQGPLLIPANDPEVPDYEVLATYRTEIARKGAPAGAMTGTHAIARGVFGKGRVICFSPHPEGSAGPHELIQVGVEWASAGRVAPASASPGD